MTGFNIGGDLLKALELTARVNGIDTALLIENVLRRGMAFPTVERPTEVTERTLINEGNGGFHLVTLVSDGYGNIVAENAEGEEGARVVWDQTTPDATFAMMEVTRRFCANLAHGHHIVEELMVESRSWLNCEICGQAKPDVAKRADSYARDIDNKPYAMHTVCNLCDARRSEDI